MLRSNIIEDVRKFLHRRDNDFLTVGDEAPQVARMLGMTDGRSDLGELLDRVSYLLIENAAIGHYDDGIENLTVIGRQSDQLVRQPGDRVRLTRAGGVLNQHPSAGTLRLRVSEQPSNDIKLMKTREELLPLPLPRLGVRPNDNLRIVLDDVSQSQGRQDVLPQIIRLQPIRVGGIAGAIIPTFVKRQKPGGLALEMGAELNLRVINGEMNHAAAEFEQLLTGVAVALILLDRILHRLFRQAVLEFERCDWKPVDEQRQIQGVGGIVSAVTKLAGDRKPVQRETLHGFEVA